MERPMMIGPSIALRSLQKTSGLFDTCVPGVTDGKVASAEIDLAPNDVDLSLVTSGNNDFLSAFMDADMATGLQLPESQDATSVTASDLGVPSSEAINGTEEDYCEIFTDLTEFLLENVGDMSAVPMLQQQPTALCTNNSNSTAATTTATTTRRRKRTATEALLDAMESEAVAAAAPPVAEEVVSQVVPSSPVVDHLGYTLKPQPRKKRGVSSTSTTSSSATVTSAPVPSTSAAADIMDVEEVEFDSNGSKSTERRIKNNIASKQSREIRKQKFLDQGKEVDRLKTANAELRVKIAEMEKTAERMKAMLVKKLARK